MSATQGQQQPTSDGSQFNAVSFVVRQMMGQMATATLVKVISISNSGDLEPVGNVSIQPMVNQIDGAGNGTPHGTIYNIPYFRLQGGSNAIILDPQVGDIGIAVFASSDLSSVKANKSASNPSSRRKFDWADGLYIGGFLNGTPSQYVQFNSDGITITSPTKITLNAPLVNINATDSVTITSPDIELDGQLTQGTSGSGYPATIQGPVTVVHDVTAGGISLDTHVHSGVQTGSGDTGPPV